MAESSAANGPTRSAFETLLRGHAGRTEAALDAVLPPEGTGAGEADLRAAMRYAVLNGGKRLRGFLALEVASLFGAPAERAERAAASVECLHAYSLVHDDMPCMDDDDLRRGRPTVHKVWDEAMAVLVGDGLQTLAFEILAAPETHPSGEVRAALCLGLARASGHGGMVGGQAIDIAAEKGAGPWGAPEVKRLQAFKTGALIAFAAEAGAILAQAGTENTQRIRAYAAAVGEAFQIADDLLDVTGTEAEVGKRVGKDADAGKATFVDILGIDGAKARAADLVSEAESALAPFGDKAWALTAAAQFVVNRRS